MLSTDRPDARVASMLCFSHLRWGFVYQRPQHLLSRFAADHRVYFMEEPVFETDLASPRLDETMSPEGVIILVPRIPRTAEAHAVAVQRALLDAFIARRGVNRPLLWYYAPMALRFSDHIDPRAIVYDCMDELANFKGAPAELRSCEAALMRRADVVFTGGRSLYEAKKSLHDDVHLFASSVDVAHFAAARSPDSGAEPPDQAQIRSPRVGYYGVIDERLDLALLAETASRLPHVQFVLLGPVVKIDPAAIPIAPNIHHLGMKSYAELPRYVRGWAAAMMPFALNDATRFISPTKTPEFLAAGKPVVSTPVPDVVTDWGGRGLVEIADTPGAFAAAVERTLAKADPGFDERADAALGDMSWDRTALEMKALVIRAAERRRQHGATSRAMRPPTAGGVSGFDYLVVGAGFAGATLAERLAAGLGKRVLVVDKRPHIGGNAYDYFNEHGVLVHRYGPHIFHTNSARIFDYLSRFTAWRAYEHRVLASVRGKLVPVPINLKTVNALYDLDLDEEGVKRFLAGRADPQRSIRTSEDVVVSAVGRELYELFFRGYTRKQWGLDPSELDKSVTARVPTRTNADDRYFADAYQYMPLHGYTRMFENMLDHPGIKIMLNTDYREIVDEVAYDQLIFTGPIDQFFDCRYGVLPYRSLDFVHETLDCESFQDAAVVNYPNEDVGFTRITEYKKLTGQSHRKTSISYEFPSAEGDPYYPVPRPENAALFKRYEALASRTPNVHFVGRLATYRYYNMDQVVGQALALFAKLTGGRVQTTAAQSGQTVRAGL